MRLIDRLVLRELVGPFLFGVMAFTSVFFAGTYLLKLTNWVMNGMPLATALQVVLLYLPSIVVYTLPMSTLLAVLLGVGRLSGDSEVVALFAGGVSLYRVAIPIIFFGIVVSICSILLNEVVAPWANVRNQDLQAVVLQQAGVNDYPFTLYDEGTGSLLRVGGGMDRNTGVLKDVTIVQFSNGRPIGVLYASRAEWAGATDPALKFRWRLYGGYWQSLGSNSGAMSSFGESNTRQVNLQKTPSQLQLYQKNPDQLTFSELSKMVAYLRTHPDRPLEKIREMDVERWNKLSLPLSSLIFAFMGAPLGIKPQRSSSSVGLGLSVFIILIYWMVWHYTCSLAIQGNLTPLAGAFTADVLGIVGAFALLRRASK